MAPVIFKRRVLATDKHIHPGDTPAQQHLADVTHREPKTLKLRQEIMSVDPIYQGVLVMILRWAEVDVLVAHRLHKDAGEFRVDIRHL